MEIKRVKPVEEGVAYSSREDAGLTLIKGSPGPMIRLAIGFEPLRDCPVRVDACWRRVAVAGQLHGVSSPRGDSAVSSGVVTAVKRRAERPARRNLANRTGTQYLSAKICAERLNQEKIRSHDAANFGFRGFSFPASISKDVTIWGPVGRSAARQRALKSSSSIPHRQQNGAQRRLVDFGVDADPCAIRQSDLDDAAAAWRFALLRAGRGRRDYFRSRRAVRRWQPRRALDDRNGNEQGRRRERVGVRAEPTRARRARSPHAPCARRASRRCGG